MEWKTICCFSNSPLGYKTIEQEAEGCSSSSCPLAIVSRDLFLFLLDFLSEATTGTTGGGIIEVEDRLEGCRAGGEEWLKPEEGEEDWLEEEGWRWGESWENSGELLSGNVDIKIVSREAESRGTEASGVHECDAEDSWGKAARSEDKGREDVDMDALGVWLLSFRIFELKGKKIFFCKKEFAKDSFPYYKLEYEIKINKNKEKNQTHSESSGIPFLWQSSSKTFCVFSLKIAELLRRKSK